MAEAALLLTRTFVSIDCCECHIEFAVLDEVIARWKQSAEHWFYCPNGHRQHYTDTEILRLKRELEKKESMLRKAEESREWYRARAEKSDRKLSAVRGVVTKIRKRVGVGVCPCCNRHFPNLDAHMHDKHPGFAEEKD